tara:strand:- start:1646 stop:2536 length:891 start_codon:yes stop_codon:yes gene_type:complete
MNSFLKITPTLHGWGYGYGFFSNYRICLEQLMLHDKRGDNRIPYIDWSGTTFVEEFNPFLDKNYDGRKYKASSQVPREENPFDWWFDQKIPLESDEVTLCNTQSDPKVLDHSKHYFDKPNELKIQKEADIKYIKVKDHILKKINDIYETEFKNEVVLGIMARGTEYNEHHPMYGLFNVYDYIREIKKVLKNNKNITKLFILSEDIDYIKAIHEAFPSSYFMPDVFRRTTESMDYVNQVHCWPNVHTGRKDHCRLLGEEVIIQARLLGKCDYLFGRLSGILTGGVIWGENIKKVYQI